MECAKIKIFKGENENVKKYVFTKSDAVYEAVVYKYGSYLDRTVICCSVQSGCPVGCVFCGTGKKFVRNLTNNEIVQQIKDVLINEEIINYTNDIKKFQIMFMSMGEPLLNFNYVSQSIQELSVLFPNAQLLLSTMEVNKENSLSELLILSKKYNQVGLQFSLHNSIESERNIIIPFKNKMTIRQLRNYGITWNIETRRRPYINYCVTSENSSNEHINKIMDLFPPQIFNFTFSVVCNADKTNKEDKTDYNRLYEIQSQFLDNGYNVRVFDPAGKDDIGGGCGQLWFVQDWLSKINTHNGQKSQSSGF